MATTQARNDFVAGDTRSTLRIDLVHDADGVALDLTGATDVKLRWRDKAGTLQERACTVADTAAGVVTYKFAAGELEAGTMRFEARVTVAGEVLSTLDPIEAMVRPSPI